MTAPGPTPWLPEHPGRVRASPVRRSVVGRGFTGVARVATLGKAYEVFRMLSLSPHLFRSYLSFNARLMPFGTLERTDTERLILRVAWRCRSRYEWEQHKVIGRRAGVGDVEIEAIGSDHPEQGHLTPHVRLLVRACDELIDQHVLSPATWAALREELDEAGILELCMLVGNYAMLAGCLNTFGVPLEPAHRRPAGRRRLVRRAGRH